jgi:heptosyltransferase-3
VSAPKVLFVSPNRIGDSVIATGIVSEINRRFPGAEITVAAGGPPAPFYRSAPGVTEIIVVDKTTWARHWIRLWRQVRGTRWDVMIDTRGSPLRLFVRAARKFIYRGAPAGAVPKVEVISRLMQAPHILEPEVFIDDRARTEARAVIAAQPSAGDGPILALAPIAHQKGKSWPRDRWGQLVEVLKTEPRFDGWRFMIVGGPGPGDDAATAPARAAAGSRGVDFVGKGDILASAAAIQDAALFAGNDSGLMHVAAAVGTPTLGLFGPTEWWLYKPWGPKGHSVASNPVQGEYAPIEDLTVEQVRNAVVALYDTYIAGKPVGPAA